MIIVGIDPGITGAVAVIYNHDADVFDIPTCGGEVDVNTLIERMREAIQDVTPDANPLPLELVLEKAQSMPKQGVKSTFNYGVTYGEIRGAVKTCGVRYHEVPAAKWKRAMGLTRDKADARNEAIKLFPCCRNKLARKKDHNRAEALLIAEYQRRKGEGVKP